jgi:hypothetical protein
MTCVKTPNGIVCLGGDIVRIMVGSRYTTFEDNSRFGPILCNRDGEVADKLFSDRSKFWTVWNEWVDGNTGPCTLRR